MRTRTGSFRRLCGAFSIVEIVVAIGVILVVIGLALPQLAGLRRSAASAHRLAVIRSNFTTMTLYADDHDGVFPIASRTVSPSQIDWNVPLTELGYFASLEDADPVGIRRYGVLRFAMSGAMCHPPEHMVPGETVPIEYARTVPIRRSQVLFPSQKGVLAQWLRIINGEHVFWTWSPRRRPVSPIAMADGSASTARCTDFALAHDFLENWVGHPVLATWAGCRGLDRRR